MDARDAHDVPPPLTAFAVDVLERGPATVVAARGELDMATAPALGRALDGLSGRVVFDLRQVSFVDMAGLRLLLELESESRRDGLELRLIPSAAAERLLDVAGMRALFERKPDAG